MGEECIYLLDRLEGYTTVTADVGSGSTNGDYSASVWNVRGQDNTKYLTVRCTFPATERNVTYINSVSITGVEEPYAGDRAKYPVGDLPSNVQYLTDNQGYYYDVAWYDGSKKMTNQEYFEEGKTYTCKMAIKARGGYEFRSDPNHLFASPGYPFPTVTVTINGKTATVMPDNSVAPGNEVIFVAVNFTCKASRKITHVDITNVTDPKADYGPDYDVTCGDSTYKVGSLTNFAYKNGIAWMDKKGNIMNVSSDSFAPSTTYTVEIRLEAVEPYVFAYTQMGSTQVTATVNGNEAVVSASPDGEKYLIVRYTFKKTAGLEGKKVEINDLEEPKSGNLPDYSITYGDTTYGKGSISDEFVLNGVLWYNDTTRKDMRPGVDRFEGGNTYTVYVFIKTTGKYTFVYDEDDDSWSVSAKVNGKTAGTEELFESDLTVWYTYTLPEDVHECAPIHVAEVKGGCTTPGKKGYYYCEDCGTYYENESATRVIENIDEWGNSEPTGHSGGKATCIALAICKNCSNLYGELADHNYGTKWDFKNESGHAHKCKECGAHDTLEPHKGGSAECGEMAKCEDCGEKYGEVIQHKWSSGLEYTDSKGHAHICSVCGDRDTVVQHSGGTADCKNFAKCALCGTEYGKLGDHKWSTTWDYTDSKGHAHSCTVAGCDEHQKTEKHTPGDKATETSAQTCTDCGYVITPALGHKHKTEKVKEVKATCTENGVESHYKCKECGALFEDSDAEKPVDKDDLIIPATGHTESKWKTNRNSHWKTCTTRGCKVEIPGSKESHEFDENNVCVVCEYEKGGKVSADEDEDEPDYDETEESDDGETKDVGSEDEKPTEKETVSPVDGDENDDGKDEGGNITLYVIIGAAILLAVIVIIVIVSSRKKKS